MIDDHLGFDLTSQADIVITVTWVAETPFFGPTIVPPAYRPNQYTHVLSVPENSTAATAVVTAAGGGAAGFSKDPWAVLSFAWTYASAAGALAFDVHSATGAVSARSGAALDLGTTPSYSFRVRVNTGAGPQDTAAALGERGGRERRC